MRKSLVNYLLQEMAVNPDIVVITCDLGYKLWDIIRDTYPDRFYNVGASEQAGTGVAVGMVLMGKIPVIYSISAFAIYRPFETIRNYMSYEQIPVKIVGGGRDKDYSHDGQSHDASDIKDNMKNLDIMQYYPEEGEDLDGVFKEFLYNSRPSYLNLKK